MAETNRAERPVLADEAVPWQAKVIVVAMFAVMAAIEWTMIGRISFTTVRNVFDLTFVLFQVCWLLGWSVGVLFAAGLAALVLFGRPVVAHPAVERMAVALQRTRAIRSIGADGEPSTAKPRASDADAPALMSPSGIALVAANLVPLAGVLFLGWNLANLVVLFWAESAVIGFYTILKLLVVGRVWGIFSSVFFAGHFGGFMTLHFLFIYEFFVRGLGAHGAEADPRAALVAVFAPIWPSLVGLLISHGISFYSNFIRGGEYVDATTKSVMSAPYSRIVVMQLALIFGGWVILLLKNPVPALAILVLVKIAVDFSSHRSEHAA